jgi:hypothetical protein
MIDSGPSTHFIGYLREPSPLLKFLGTKGEMEEAKIDTIANGGLT